MNALRTLPVALLATFHSFAAACSGSPGEVGGPAATAHVTGRCVDAAGAPRSGVDVGWSGVEDHVHSGADGRFRLELTFDAHFEAYPATLALGGGDAPAREVPVRVHDGEVLDLGDVVVN